MVNASAVSRILTAKRPFPAGRAGSVRVKHRARHVEDDRIQVREVELEFRALSFFHLPALVDHHADSVPADLDVSHRVTTRMSQRPADDLLTEIVVLCGDALEGELPAVVLLAPKGSPRRIA